VLHKQLGSNILAFNSLTSKSTCPYTNSRYRLQLPLGEEWLYVTIRIWYHRIRKDLLIFVNNLKYKDNLISPDLLSPYKFIPFDYHPCVFACFRNFILTKFHRTSYLNRHPTRLKWSMVEHTPEIPTSI
jgi:hypothetical protein